MTASELRIGNWINKVTDFAGKNNYIQATIEDIVKVKEHPSHYIDIPLTEEWLLKFGFEESGGHFETNPALWVSIGGLTGPTDIWIHGEYVPSVKIGYVHQLQNLYFALTGQELLIH